MASTTTTKTTTTTTETGAVRTETVTISAPAATVTPASDAPALTMETDTRLHPASADPVIKMGMGGAQPACPVGPKSSRDEIHAFGLASEQGYTMLLEGLSAGLDPTRGGCEIEESVETVKGGSGQEMKLIITRPKASKASEPLPCIYHIHGGAMACLHCKDFSFYCKALASRKVVVVQVEFRNCSGADGANPFPSGLDDCLAGVQWVHDNRAALGINKIIVSGESGGGNLAIATTAKAIQSGKTDMIQGLFPQCPYIAGPRNYIDPPAELQSLRLNNGVFLGLDTLVPFAVVYTSDTADETNPLAWPYYMTEENTPLSKMPPTVITVDECDPLRDEGVVLGRRMAKAGVEVVTRQTFGAHHGADCTVPDTPMFRAIVRDAVAFAYSC